MEITDNIKPRGVFFMQIKNAAGDILETIEEANLIVNGGRDAIMKLIADADTDKQVNQIAFGSNGSAPVLTDTTITDEFKKAVGSAVYTTDSVAISWTLGTSENNGATIREFGLLCDDDTLFARKIRGTAIAKTSSIQLQGTWTLYF